MAEGVKAATNMVGWAVAISVLAFMGGAMFALSEVQEEIASGVYSAGKTAYRCSLITPIEESKQ